MSPGAASTVGNVYVLHADANSILNSLRAVICCSGARVNGGVLYAVPYILTGGISNHRSFQ